MNTKPSSRTIAIGDVHGCAVALRAIIEAIELRPDDTLVVLGDCVDRGPDSCGAVEQLIEIRESCRLIPLLGNHEEMMLNYLDKIPQPDDWMLCGGRETLESYRSASDPHDTIAQHADYIRTWGDYWETDSHFFVHGAYYHEAPLEGQRWNLFRWQSLREYVPEPHASGKTAVVGHTSQKTGEIYDIGYLKCIDTFCYGGGWLTALDTNSGEVWQADVSGNLRE